MENWVLLSKLILLAYFILTYVYDKTYKWTNMTQVVTILLIYIFLNLCKSIFESSNFRFAALFFSIVLCTASFALINPLFIIFVPLNVFELIKWRTDIGFVILSVVFFLIFLVKTVVIRELFLCTSFSFLLHELLTLSYARINTLSKTNDHLMEQNEKLLINAQNSAEYESQIIYTSKLEERNKIAQEIHDKLGHSISGSVMQLEAAKLLLEIDTEKSKSIIQTAIDNLRIGMESIRSTLKSIKPPSEQMGINKVKLLLNDFSKNSGISGQMYYEGDIDIINFRQWKVIYDNINEALTNTMKYSEARNVSIKIQVFNKVIKAEIKDDGKGCTAYTNGIGITGIEERTAGINGKVIVDGSDGFSIITLLPILHD